MFILQILNIFSFAYGGGGSVGWCTAMETAHWSWSLIISSGAIPHPITNRRWPVKLKLNGTVLVRLHHPLQGNPPSHHKPKVASQTETKWHSTCEASSSPPGQSPVPSQTEGGQSTKCCGQSSIPLQCNLTYSLSSYTKALLLPGHYIMSPSPSIYNLSYHIRKEKWIYPSPKSDRKVSVQ